MVNKTVQKPEQRQNLTGIAIIDRLQAAFPGKSFARAAVEQLGSTGDIIRFLDAYSAWLERYDPGLVHLMKDGIKDVIYDVAQPPQRITDRSKAIVPSG